MNKSSRSKLAILALLSALTASAARYTGEYFWNTDPGVGKATKMTSTDVGADGKMEVTLNAAQARAGINLLGMRVFNGRWSTTAVQYVFVPQVPESISKATCEYWWDKDPGVGAGKQLTMDSDGSGVLALTLDALDLKPALHTVGLRTNVNGRWSTTAVQYVFVPQVPESISKATCEYWWDKDPGVGAGKQVTVDSNGSGVLALTLEAEGLKPGFHTVGLRTNVNGRWSTTMCSAVFVKDPTVAKIDAAEYYWGDDPGYGNGTPISLTESDVVVIEDLTIDFPAESRESYTLTIRAHSKTAGWGFNYTKVFTPVHAVGLTLDKDALTYRKLGVTQQLTATPNPGDSWERRVAWSSSNAKVATVDADGVVTSVGEGSAVITATLEELGFTAECTVTVVDETKYPLGDSNGNYEVTVTDVATTVSEILGGKPAKFVFTPADVTCDESITIADVVGTVNIILGVPQANAPRHIRRMEGNDALRLTAKAMGSEQAVVGIALDNEAQFTALQFDLTLPEGVAPAGEDAFRCGSRTDNSHHVAWMATGEGSYRVAVYSLANSCFYGEGGEVLTLDLLTTGMAAEEAEIAVTGIRAVEPDATEHLLADCSTLLSTPTGVESAAADCDVKVYAEGRTLYVSAKRDMHLQLTAMDGISRMLDVKAGLNTYSIEIPGVYVINGTKIIIN